MITKTKKWKMMFFCQWHRHTRIKIKNPSAPNRIQTYDPPISTSDALPLSHQWMHEYVIFTHTKFAVRLEEQNAIILGY